MSPSERIALYATIGVIIATLLGPIFAVQIQRRLDRRRAVIERQTAIFRTLMTERLAISQDAVRALNVVPVEFYSVTTVLQAFRAYLNHLGTSTTVPNWTNTRVDLFLDLLQKMAEHLGYAYNFVQLKSDFYWPTGHSTLAQDEETIRRGLADIMSGKKTLPMDVHQFPADAELNGLLKAWLKSQLPSGPTPPPMPNSSTTTPTP